LGAVLATLLLACSSQNPEQPDASGGAPNTTDAGVALGQPVWTSASRHITMTCTAFSSGMMGFDADRTQLTDQQLTLLDQMLTGPRGEPIEDGLGCSVQITASDGAVNEYLAVQEDGAVPGDTLLITYASFQPFLATVPCGFSAEQAPQHPIAPDRRCVNGIFFQPSPGNVDRFLTITDPAPQRHIELDACDAPAVAGILHLQVLSADATDGGVGTILVEGTAPPAPTSVHTCQILNVTFPAAGTYRMRVVVDAPVRNVSTSTFLFY
jgi:hypothetical protein